MHALSFETCHWPNSHTKMVKRRQSHRIFVASQTYRVKQSYFWDDELGQLPSIQFAELAHLWGASYVEFGLMKLREPSLRLAKGTCLKISEIKMNRLFE